MEYPILSKISSPDDVKSLPEDSLDSLCKEIRECIISTVSKNGGHLASSLGAVELTVAIHRAFSSPEDAIIFDVGHQSYAHKLLTGRFDRFETLRCENGLSGFMRPAESIHDPFVTGHSSNSISAAYGIYTAKKMKGENGTAVAVIGDGAMTGGMAYEGLNNAGNTKGNFIVIINDNEMSISRNVGSVAKMFTKLRNRPRYHHFKSALGRFLVAVPLIGKPAERLIRFIKEVVKRAVYRTDEFSALGFNYLGPVDGHNIDAMTSLFNVAKEYQQPCVVHVVTTKGKGYPYAETSPGDYHGVSPFDAETGVENGNKKNFSSVAGEALCELAETDSRVCAVTAAMTEGTGLKAFSEKFKDRFFDVGIAEQHAVTFSAGLASAGMKPFFVVYSSFLQRGFDQIVHDVAIGGFPVRLLIDRAGIVGEDGESHQGVFDVSYLTCIPGMQIFSPSNYSELEYRIKYVGKNDGIFAVRYPRGCEKACPVLDHSGDITFLKGDSHKVIVTYGRLFSEAVEAKESYPSVNIIKLNRIYPLSDETVDLISSFKEIYFFEETVKKGGIGEYLSSILLEKGFVGKFELNAINNRFVPVSGVKKALENCGIDNRSMLKRLKGADNGKNQT